MDHIKITGVSKLDDTGASTLNAAIARYQNLHNGNDIHDEGTPALDPKKDEDRSLSLMGLGEFRHQNSFIDPTEVLEAPIKEIWSLPNLEVTIGEGSGQKSSPFSIPMEDFEDYCFNHGFSGALLQKFVSKGPMFEHQFIFAEGSKTPSHLEIAMATFENDCFFCLFRYNIAQRSAVCLLFIKTLDYLKTRPTHVHEVKYRLDNRKDILSRHPFIMLSVVLSFMQSRTHEHLRLRLDLYEMESRLGVTRNGQLLVERGYGKVCYDFGLLNADLAGFSKQIADTELSASTMMEYARSIERLVETCEGLEASSDPSSNRSPIVSEQREEIRSAITRAEVYLKHTTMARAILQSLEAVLYNRINKQDTDAMKTIAVVTLVFLPATFVSAVFSTGIFNFHASDSPNEPRTISKYGWVYLVVCILSTALTLLSWVGWYRWGRHWIEKKEFSKMQTPVKLASYGLSRPVRRAVLPISRPKNNYKMFSPAAYRRA